MPDELPDLSKFAIKQPNPAGDETVAHVVDDELSKLGWSENARLSFLGDVGRENGWNRDVIFGGHVDPASYKNGRGKIENRGIISWNGDRKTKLDQFLQSEGVYGKRDDDELRGMVRFADKEMRESPEWEGINAKLRDPNISTYDASENLRKYIKYVPDGQYNSPDPEFRVKNNAIWAKRAKSLGLGTLPDLSKYGSNTLPDLSRFAAPPVQTDLRTGNITDQPTQAQVADFVPQQNALAPDAPIPPTIPTPNFPIETLGAIPGTGEAFPPAEAPPPQTIDNLQSPFMFGNPNEQIPDKNGLTQEQLKEAEKLQEKNPTAEGYNQQLAQIEKDYAAAQSEYKRKLAEYNAAQTVQPQSTLTQAQSTVLAPGTYDNLRKSENNGLSVEVDLSKTTDDQNYINKEAARLISEKFNVPEADAYTVLQKYPLTKGGGGAYTNEELDALPSVRFNLTPGLIDEIRKVSESKNIDYAAMKEISPEVQAEEDARRAREELLRQQAITEFQNENTPYNNLGDEQRDAWKRMNPDFVPPTPSEEELNNRIEELRASSLSPEKAQMARNVGANLNNYLGETGGALAGGIIGSGGRVFNAAAGIVRPLRSIGIDQPFNEFSKIAKYAESIQANSGNDGIISEVVKTVGGLPGDLSRLAVVSKVGKNSIIAFGVDSGLQAAGADKSFNEIKKAASKGATIGALFPASSVLGKSVSANPAIQTIAKIGIIGTGTTGVEWISGTPLGESIKAGITNALFEAAPILKNKIYNKVGRFWQKDKPIDIAFDEQGNMSLVRFKDQSNPNRVDFEMVLDPTDGVYKDAAEVGRQPRRIEQNDAPSDTGANRSNIASNPRVLSETNPRRVESADTTLEQKIAVDTRAQKIIAALKDGKAATVEQIQKLTRINKNNIETAILDLYGARQVEILPDNSVRFIGKESAPVSKSLYERAAEVETQKTPINLGRSSIENEINETIQTAPEQKPSSMAESENVSVAEVPPSEKELKNDSSVADKGAIRRINENTVESNPLDSNRQPNRRDGELLSNPSQAADNSAATERQQRATTETVNRPNLTEQLNNVPTESGKLVRVGEREINLTPEQAKRWETEVDAPLEAAKRKRDQSIAQNPRFRQTYEREYKGTAFQIAAKKREITGLLTPTEQEEQRKREKSNYNGKAVSVNGRNGKVVGTSFGKVKVQFKDGSEQRFEAAEISAPVATPENRIEETPAQNEGRSPDLAAKGESDHVQTETDNEIEALPISQRVTASDLGDTEFTRAKVASSVGKEKPSNKTGFTKTQTEWFVGEIQKAYEQLAPTNYGDSLRKIRKIPGDRFKNYLEEHVDKAEEITIDVPGDGVFKFHSRDGIDRIHKSLTGKTVEDFRKAQEEKSDAFEKLSLPKGYGKVLKEANLLQDQEETADREIISVEAVNNKLGAPTETSEKSKSFGVRQVSNGYWIQQKTKGGENYTAFADASPIKVKGYEEYDLFANKDSGEFSITDGITGFRTFSGKTLPEAVEKLQQFSKEKLDAAIQKELDKGVISPRYEKSEATEPKPEPTRDEKLGAEVGEYGQTSHHLRKNGFANDIFEVATGEKSRLNADSDFKARQAEGNRALDAIAESLGKPRSSHLSEADWKRWLDTHADNLPLETTQKVLSALAESETWHKQRTAFIESPEIDTILKDIETSIGFENIESYAKLPLKIRREILKEGRKYARLTDDTIRKTFERGLQTALAERASRGEGRDGSEKDKGAGENQEKGAARAEKSRTQKLTVGDKFRFPNSTNDIWEVVPSGKYQNKNFYKIKNLSTGETVDKPFKQVDIARLERVGESRTKLERPQFALADKPKNLAPNGKPSKLTPRQQADVQTPEFKKFFGDSKVVDKETGEPLVVYHGTENATDIDSFNSGSNIAGWFTESPKYAAVYANEIGGDYGDSQPAIIPTFLKVEKPFDVSSLSDRDFVSIKEVFDAAGEQLPQNLKAEFGDEQNRAFSWIRDFPSVVDTLKSLGYDAVKSAEGVDRNLSYGVFNSNQIKSAIGNNGEFSSENDSILRANISITPTNARERALVRTAQDLAQKNTATDIVLARANATNKDGVTLLNENATEYLRRVLGKVFEENHAAFLGGYLKPSHIEALQDYVENDLQGESLRPYAAKKARAILQTIIDNADSVHNDNIILTVSKDVPEGLKEARQEEFGHRAITRSGAEDVLIELAETPSIKKSLETVGEKYSGLSETGKINEVIAKSLRTDATTELNISKQEARANRRAFIKAATEQNIDLDNLANELENVSQKGKGLAKYARNIASERRGSNAETFTSRTPDSRRVTDGLSELRRRGLRDSGRFTGNESDRISRLRQTELSQANRGAASLITRENSLVESRFKNNPEQLAAAKAEISFARATEPKTQTYGDYVIDGVSIFKSLKSTGDLSAAGRQGWLLTLTHPKIGARAFKKQLLSLNEKNHEKFVRDLNLHPFIEMAEDSGLFLSNLADESSLTEREEAFMSRLLGDERFFESDKFEKPRRFVTAIPRAAERAYTTYLDDLRINTFALFAKQVHQYNQRKGIADNETYAEQMRAIADFVNNATGRGDLGTLNDFAPKLNAAFFSARYWKSRLQIMNPLFYARMPQGARSIALKNLASFAGATALLMLLWKLGGGEIDYDDPQDPDMLKLKWGNYSYDITAGTIGHLRYIARLATALKDGDARKSLYLTERYGRSKLAPVPGGAWSAFTGKNYVGEPTDLQNELLDLPKPLLLGSFRDAAKADGSLGLIKTMPEFFGVGVTRFKTPAEIRAQIAEERKNLGGSKAQREEANRKIETWEKLLDRTKDNEVMENRKKGR